MRALVSEQGAVRLDHHWPEPELAGDMVLVRPTRLGVTPADLRAVRAGRFSGVLGSEFVGVVEKLGPDAAGQDHLLGKRVVGSPLIVCGECDLCQRGLSQHCRAGRVIGRDGADGCFAERFVVGVRQIAPVPDGVDDDAALFAGCVARAVHAARRVRVEGKPYVTVLGDTPLALITAQIMASLNGSVRCLGDRPAAYGLCEKWGVKHRHIREVGLRHDQDIVIDCADDRPEFGDLALGLVRPRGKIVLMSAGDGPRLDPHEIIEHEVEVYGVASGNPCEGLTELDKGVLDVVSLISRRVRLVDGLSVLRAAAEPEQLKVVIDP